MNFQKCTITLGFCKSGHICTANLLVIYANQCNGLLCCDIALLCIKLLVTIIVIQLQQHTMDPLLGTTSPSGTQYTVCAEDYFYVFPIRLDAIYIHFFYNTNLNSPPMKIFSVMHYSASHDYTMYPYILQYYKFR